MYFARHSLARDSLSHAMALLIAMLTLLPALAADEPAQGRNLGAINSEKPGWFKQSFLEFEDDVGEAAAAGRRVMLYFHQDGCPYCARLMAENFNDPELKPFIIRHFDAIALNLWGDREVVSIAGQDFSEKTFAAAFKVQYTPTLVFLDEKGRIVLRLDGYYPPPDMRAALDYVAQKLEGQLSFAQYRLQQRASSTGQLIAEDFYLDPHDLQRLLGDPERPLVVYFESPSCADCRTLHRRILTDQATRKLVRQANNVQLQVDSTQPIITPSGDRTSVRRWAQELGIAYTPSLIFFDAKGTEVMRIGAFVKTFHFQSVYAYVLEQAYLQQPEFQRYLSARAEHIRAAGFDTDIWGYQSFHD